MPTTDEPDMSAAELALGLLDGEPRTAALRRVLAEPSFAREVERWRNLLASLYAEWPAVEPGPSMARRVAAMTDVRGAEGAHWRWAAGLLALAAVLLLTVLVSRPSPKPQPSKPVVSVEQPLIAVLKPKEGEPFGVIFDPATREMRLSGAVRVPPKHVAELWAIGGDGVPRAAGLLPAGQVGRVTLPSELAVGAGTTLAISIEPTGGSPKPTPSGPVVATGVLAIV